MANYSFGKTPLPSVNDGHVFTGDNFTQMFPHTKIFVGVRELRFVNCNLTNCDPPEDATFVGGSPKHVSFCSHVRPKLVAKGLPQCAENCSHLAMVDTVSIDSVSVLTENHYEETPVE